jgi:hypothetical protein
VSLAPQARRVPKGFQGVLLNSSCVSVEHRGLQAGSAAEDDGGHKKKVARQISEEEVWLAASPGRRTYVNRMSFLAG